MSRLTGKRFLNREIMKYVQEFKQILKQLLGYIGVCLVVLSSQTTLSPELVIYVLNQTVVHNKVLTS